MSQPPFERVKGLQIGTVDFVSPNEVKVLLDIEAPDSVALNAGGVRPFPRVNGYVLLPVDDAYLVGQVEWLTIERSAFPQRRGVRDFGLVDLPYPLRRMSTNPVGTLRKQPGQGDNYKFRRGADALPTVGGAVILPTERQLRAIVESGEQRRVRIGTSPLAANAEVCIDPDRLFGRHLAVLGQTGSGKSCTVAGLIRWSILAAREARGDVRPNARFIVLDPNGEYARAFKDSEPELKARIFKVNLGAAPDGLDLKVPLWFWNSAEWASFTQASAKTQRPALVQALRFVRDGHLIEEQPSRSHEIRRFLRTIVAVIRIEKNSGSPWGAFPKPKSFFEKLEKWKQSLEPELASFNGEEHENLSMLINTIEGLCSPRKGQYPHYDFTRPEVLGLLDAASQAHAAFGGMESDGEVLEADIPRRFTASSLIRSVEAAAEMMGTSEYVETLLIRIRSLLAEKQIMAVMDDGLDLTLERWLADYIGKDEAADGEIAVLDLSLVPSEVIHIVTAVAARMVFEALQRYRKLNGKVLPTVLVMEEAHTFIRRYKADAENQDAAAICCQVFERIAREGRKFGLGLVLSSQRPSELSQTVLSQCNTYILHRISNDRDQELVNKLVPDNLRGLLRELPSLPSQHAILLGWASELPVLTRIQDLPLKHRPQSEDPDFWDVWRGKDEKDRDVPRKIDWGALARDWQGYTQNQGTGDTGEEDE